MRIVQLCWGMVPRAAATSGGELRYWQNLKALAALGHEMHVVLFTARDIPADHLDGVRTITPHVYTVRMHGAEIDRVTRVASLFLSGPLERFFFPQATGKLREVQALVDRIEPDLMWAEWIGAMLLVGDRRPVLYSHHDFHHRIIEMRARYRGQTWGLEKRLRQRRLRRLEMALAQRASAVLCVSASERNALESEGVGDAYYIPIVGPTVLAAPEPGDDGRIMLFGRWNNTAMRNAVIHLHDALWPQFDDEVRNASWHQVGTVGDRPGEHWPWVEQHFNVHGFVEDLGSVFRLGDACLVAYPEDTGFRTKMVMAAAYGLIPIGYVETFKCVPEFTPGVDCLVADSPPQLAALLKDYVRDRELRVSLGQAARRLYEERFSFEAQLPCYRDVIGSAVDNAGRARR